MLMLKIWGKIIGVCGIDKQANGFLLIIGNSFMQYAVCTNKLEYHNTGCLLLDERLRGHLYTREVWIQDMTEEDLDHGIDINELVMILRALTVHTALVVLNWIVTVIPS